MSGYLAIALDLGTTSIKGGLLGREGTLQHVVFRPSPQIDSRCGHYESDALAYAETVEQVLYSCITQAGGCNTLGMCSQRSSFLLWERGSGQPVTPLISWQDNSGAMACEALRAHEPLIRERTGLPLAPYYFGPKLSVLLKENPSWLERLQRGEWLAGTLDSFLIWRWSGGRHFITDASMAARTLLMDIRAGEWSPLLCELFGIPLQALPGIRDSAGMGLQLDNGLIVQASVGDQSAALVAGIKEGAAEAMANLGTGCFVVRYSPLSQTESQGYLHTLVYQDRQRVMHFAIEGTLNSTAAALAPYPASECDIDDLAQDDIYCIAEPSGIGAPYFRGDIGLRFSAPIDHLSPRRVAALLLEAIIFRVTRILEAFHHDSPLQRVYLSGGLSELPALQEGIAQCAPCEVLLLRQNEASLLGVALLAASRQPESRRDVERIWVARGAGRISDKYRKWSAWFDGLLAGK